MTKIERKYLCTCHSLPAHHNRSTVQVEHPVRDERGRMVYDTKRDPKTKQYFEVLRTVKQNANGLGSWSCPVTRTKAPVEVVYQKAAAAQSAS